MTGLWDGSRGALEKGGKGGSGFSSSYLPSPHPPSLSPRIAAPTIGQAVDAGVGGDNAETVVSNASPVEIKVTPDGVVVYVEYNGGAVIAVPLGRASVAAPTPIPVPTITLQAINPAFVPGYVSGAKRARASRLMLCAPTLTPSHSPDQRHNRKSIQHRRTGGRCL